VGQLTGLNPVLYIADFLVRVADLNAVYRVGCVRVYVPDGLKDGEHPLDDLVGQYLPSSHAALEAASRSLFFSLPIAFDPAESVGPYLATVDRDQDRQPYRFLDMGALIATQAFGENDPAIVQAILEHLPYVASRYAHSEYQTALSLRLKAELSRIALAGTPRHFVVNTGAEAVENAIKSVLLNRVKTIGEADGGFIVSFEKPFMAARSEVWQSPIERKPAWDFRRSTGLASCFRSRIPGRRRKQHGAKTEASSSSKICSSRAGYRTPTRARTPITKRWIPSTSSCRSRTKMRAPSCKRSARASPTMS
jgi:hypothetical protein